DAGVEGLEPGGQFLLAPGWQRRVDVAPLVRVGREVVVLGRPARVVVLHVERVGEAQGLVARGLAGEVILLVWVAVAGRAVVLDQGHVAPAGREARPQQPGEAAALDLRPDADAGELLEGRPQVDVGRQLGDRRTGRDARAGDHQRHADVVVPRALL